MASFESLLKANGKAYSKRVEIHPNIGDEVP
jgi:hypothetical protein